MVGLELYIYIDGVSRRVELFKDEVITLNSSIQNANDISKTFTDYTGSFTIPASPTNNSIFKHWYENEVENGFDHRVRYDAYIEIDTIPFRQGKIQIEKANRKGGYIENYSITFYGNLVQLKDRFGEDMLGSLDYSSLDFNYSFTEIYNRITTTASYDVRYPLIGASYSYEYGTFNPLYDVTIKPINWTELAPACKVSKIFNFIEARYGIGLTGSFLTNYQQFSKLWLLLKNTQNTGTNYSAAIQGLWTNVYTVNGNYYADTVTDSFWGMGGSDTGSLYINVSPGYETISYIVYIYSYNSSTGLYDILEHTYNLIGSTSIGFNTNKNYTFRISSYGSFSFSTQYSVSVLVDYDSQGYPNYADGLAAEGATQSTSSAISIATSVPQIKVADFFMGIVKMFNLIINPINSNTFELVPLELYYDNGLYRDITQYVIDDDISIERPKLYNKMEFSYEKSSNVLNTKFNELFGPVRGYDYGDLNYIDTNSNEKQTYTVKLPFENIMWQKSIVGTYSYNFMSAAMVNKDLKPYIPKPVLMYENGVETLQSGASYSIKFTGGGTSSKYFRFCSDFKSGTASNMSDVITINWGEELSPWFLDNASESLFHRHYENYIVNLYNVKTRNIKVKAILPKSILTTIKLNDKLIIRDKRYLINNMSTNLMSGVVSFDLITDYRIAGQPSNIGI